MDFDISPADEKRLSDLELVVARDEGSIVIRGRINQARAVLAREEQLAWERKRALALEHGVLFPNVGAIKTTYPAAFFNERTFARDFSSSKGPNLLEGQNLSFYYCPRVCQGWVRGVPLSRTYDDTGPLSGSAGTEYSCRLCHASLGRDAHTYS